MNERLKELVRQAKQSNPNLIWEDAEIERFAELIRADEREAVIDIVARHGGSVEIEAAVRQRGEK